MTGVVRPECQALRECLIRHLVPPMAEAGTRGHTLRLADFVTQGEHVMEGVLYTDDARWWWIADGIARLLSPQLYRNREMERKYGPELDRLGLPTPDDQSPGAMNRRVEHQTIDRFGDEWRVFCDWGYHTAAPEGRETEYQGGLWANTLNAFASKTFLDDHVRGKLCLDAGCGNGRFTAAALACGASEVIAVDIGWGVEACFDHHRDDPRVHVVQASLFELPIRRVDVAYSIGVLMHTGDAHRAFSRIACAVKPGGLFAVRMYHRGNPAYELTDRAIRSATTRMSRSMQMKFARKMSDFGRWIGEHDARSPGTRVRWYQILRNWPTVHHNLDWWGAPVATHHTVPEVLGWARDAGLVEVRTDPVRGREHYPFWEWPESLTVLMARQTIAAGVSIDAKPLGTATEMAAQESGKVL